MDDKEKLDDFYTRDDAYKFGQYNSNFDDSPEKWYQNCFNLDLCITKRIPIIQIEMPIYLWVILIGIIAYIIF